MRFLVDAQLPPALARWIEAQGQEAAHVGDLGMGAAKDGAIWAHALDNASIIVTKDEDFARRRAMVQDGPAVVWIRLPNTRRRDLLIWFESMFPQILAALAQGEVLIEIADAHPI